MTGQIVAPIEEVMSFCANNAELLNTKPSMSRIAGAAIPPISATHQEDD
jgi:hypothetical protein